MVLIGYGSGISLFTDLPNSHSTEAVASGFFLFSFLPTFWMTAAMHNSNNYDKFFLDSIIDCKGKPMNDGTPDASVNNRIQTWVV